MVSVSQYLATQAYANRSGPLAVGGGGIQKPEEEEKPKWWEELGYRNKWDARKGGQLSQLDELKRQLLPLIDQATQGAFLAQTEALGAGREQSLDLAAQNFAAAGGAPSVFATNVSPEIDRQYFDQVGELAGGAQAARAGSIASLLSELTSSKLGVENYFEGLRSQEKIGGQAAGATKEAGQLGLGGGFLGLLGDIIGKLK